MVSELEMAMLLRIERKLDDASEEWLPLLFLNLGAATGADCVKFLAEVAELVASDDDAMERMARAEGRTTKHALYGGVGTVPVGNAAELDASVTLPFTCLLQPATSA